MRCGGKGGDGDAADGVGRNAHLGRTGDGLGPQHPVNTDAETVRLDGGNGQGLVLDLDGVGGDGLGEQWGRRQGEQEGEQEGQYVDATCVFH